MMKTVKAPKGYHWMKKGNSYKLMKGAYKPHKGAVKVAKFAVQKDILDETSNNALEKRYQAQISEADATLKIYLENSVGIGEHPQHIDEVDKLIEKIANAEEKLKILKEFQ